MGSVTFVPGNQFPNYGDGNVSGFNIDIIQNCLPSSLFVRVDGIFDTYAYVIKDTFETTVCSGNIVHNGSGSGTDSNEYEVCIGFLTTGNLYTLTVTKSGKTETITFDAIDCGVLYPLQATYNCSTGLEITCEGVCTSADIVKVEDATETVALPLASPVFLEEGIYSIVVGLDSVEVTVDCNVVVDSSYSICNDVGDANFTVLLDNVISGETYTIETRTTDEVPVLVNTDTVVIDGVPQTTGEVLNDVGYVVNVFDTPPIDESTAYTVKVIHTSLNAKAFLGTFSATIADVSTTATTIDCTTNTADGDPVDVHVSNINCDADGINFDIEIVDETNITFVEYSLEDENSVGFFFERETYVGINNNRTVSIPSSAFGGCTDINFSILFTIKAVTGATTTWYNLRLDSDLVSAYFTGCPWAQTCVLIS